jgi:hypothetical protein
MSTGVDAEPLASAPPRLNNALTEKTWTVAPHPEEVPP